MIVSDSMRLDVGFDVARFRPANLIHENTLLTASRHAYGEGQAAVRVGPVGDAPGLSKLVDVQFRDLVTRGDNVLLTLRWEASGGRGGLFPALDADITLSPSGEHACVLRLDGAYRPPLGGIGAGLDRASAPPDCDGDHRGISSVGSRTRSFIRRRRQCLLVN